MILSILQIIRRRSWMKLVVFISQIWNQRMLLWLFLSQVQREHLYKKIMSENFCWSKVSNLFSIKLITPLKMSTCSMMIMFDELNVSRMCYVTHKRIELIRQTASRVMVLNNCASNNNMHLNVNSIAARRRKNFEKLKTSFAICTVFHIFFFIF